MALKLKRSKGGICAIFVLYFIWGRFKSDDILLLHLCLTAFDYFSQVNVNKSYQLCTCILIFCEKEMKPLTLHNIFDIRRMELNFLRDI